MGAVKNFWSVNFYNLIFNKYINKTKFVFSKRYNIYQCVLSFYPYLVFRKYYLSSKFFKKMVMAGVLAGFRKISW